MKTIAIAAVLAAATFAAPALAQDHAGHATAAAAASAALSVETTLINDIVKNEKAKAALEKVVPAIADYYDQIGEMTLAQVVPLSQGQLDEEKLKLIQAEFDALK